MNLGPPQRLHSQARSSCDDCHNKSPDKNKLSVSKRRAITLNISALSWKSHDDSSGRKVAPKNRRKQVGRSQDDHSTALGPVVTAARKGKNRFEYRRLYADDASPRNRWELRYRVSLVLKLAAKHPW